MSHGDRINKNAAGLLGGRHLAERAVRDHPDETRKYYGLMFHPEVVHTPDGAKLIRNFVRKIAGLSGDWTMRAFRDEEIAKIRAQVGKGQVLCGLSGGVNSAVAAVLIHEAIGDQLTCVFVDHGLLRLDEAKTVVDLFRDHYNIPLVHVDASKQFLGELEGVTDPETKRKTIGRLFIEVFEREANEDRGADFLAQGTLYPDVIESVSFTGGPSVTIKSHHNVGGLPERMNMKLVEPLRELFKDEVRTFGRELGLPKSSSAATRSRAPASPSAAPATSPATSSTSCARPMPSTSTKSASTASTTTSGRPSPCCCRSRQWASWATGAPTTTSWACAQ